MSCYSPIAASRTEAGGVKLYRNWPGTGTAAGEGQAMELPCGRCVGCRLDKARAWSVRIVHEAQLYDYSWFATLTYDDKFLSSDSLEYRDFQLFMKRLRRKVEGDREGPAGGRPLRFFCAGEYGGRTFRPHFHAILFNLRTRDEEQLFNGRYRSKLLEETWENGNVVLDVVNAQTAAYVAGYTQKKVYGRSAKDFYGLRRPEFCAMSLKPGIGAWWYQKFHGDMFPGDVSIVAGKRTKVPRYYYEKFRAEADAGVVEQVEWLRYQRALERRSESRPERLAVREELAERRVAFFQERAL